MKYASWFESKHRDSGERFDTLKDGCPGWLHDAVMAAHDDELPNDWRYSACRWIVEHLDGLEAREVADADGFEFADGYSDPYTSDLLKWYADDVRRTSYADDARDEYGPAESLWQELARGQVLCIEGMFSTLRDAYAEALADDEVTA